MYHFSGAFFTVNFYSTQVCAIYPKIKNTVKQICSHLFSFGYFSGRRGGRIGEIRISGGKQDDREGDNPTEQASTISSAGRSRSKGEVRADLVEKISCDGGAKTRLTGGRIRHISNGGKTDMAKNRKKNKTKWRKFEVSTDRGPCAVETVTQRERSQLVDLGIFGRSVSTRI